VITQQLAELMRSALDSAIADGAIETEPPETIEFERPKRREHGDWATNVAMILAKKAGAKPRDVAAAIVDRLPASELVEAVEVAGPGFLNFRLSSVWLHDVVRRAADPSLAFGRAERPSGVTMNVEYVSANPTGPTSIVLGRHAAVGDAMAALLEAVGHEVTREYYFNDAGRQVIQFALSVDARYRQSLGIDAEFPEDGYHGEYVMEIAAALREEVGEELLTLPDEERLERVRSFAVPLIMGSIQATLDRFGTTFDVWFSEARLHERGEVMAAIDKLREKGLIEEREGAVWFLSSRLGDDKDRVVVRSDGTPTYFAADLGYVLDKFARGFDDLIYLWGADHHGTIPRLMAAAEALGFERSRIRIPLVQTVSLVRGGEAVKGSKRAGVIIPLDELIDEVGVDAARYTFLTRSIDAPLTFDIDQVTQQNAENPVYYVQYAHARICSILRKAKGEGVRVDPDASSLRSMHPSEEGLMRKLATYEEIVPEAAAQLAPQKITRYVEELAGAFSSFYRDCRVVSDDRELTLARIALCVATKNVIASGLRLLGVTAPERM
jgi:arginyl-tRNA synthetase